MTYALVALDTDRIKSYVFGTDRLREIRGASSILDRLNRQAMEEIAKRLDPGAEVIYANGGSGLFLVAEEKAEEFVRSVQAKYREETQGGAAVTGAVQRLPAELTGRDLWEADLHKELDLLRYKLRCEKERPPAALALPSHPLLQPCDSCGLEYAAERSPWAEAGRQDRRYCPVCHRKRKEDAQIKKSIEGMVAAKLRGKALDSAHGAKQAVLWKELIELLPLDYFQEAGQPLKPERPRDLDTLRAIASASRESVRDYLGLVYADGNSMGSRIEKLSTLNEIQSFAEAIDGAIYKALASAVARHLRPVYVSKLPNAEEDRRAEESNQPEGGCFFPFDLLLLGGDDLMLVTSAYHALDVALEVARAFREQAQGQGATLSIGVVLAPYKYPFGLMHDLVENALRFAKKHGHAAKLRGAGDGDDTRINFLVVAGASTHEFDYLYKTVYCRRVDNAEFRATLRPYRLPELEDLLQAIRTARREGFPRSKLHQLREAILKTNLTSAVVEALAALQGCREKERNFLLTWLYEFTLRYCQDGQRLGDRVDPFQGFPRFTFPWSRLQLRDAERREIYQTPLLDLIELYDFVVPQEGVRESED